VEGLEFASLFSEMGTRVTVLEMLPQMLAGMDDDLTRPLFKRLKANGVSLQGSSTVASVSASASGVKAVTVDGRVFDADFALIAMARRPVLPDGIEKTGLTLINERIQVDDNCKTQLDHIYCIGDLNGRMEMAHAALQQGILLADHLAKGTPVSWSYGPLPRAMFTLPQNGGAGMQEKELQDQGTPYRKAAVRWAETWRGAGQADPEGFLKVLAGIDGTLLGIWMVGSEISEQIGLMGMLLEQGATVNDLKRQLFVHPTLSEALLQAVLQLS
jgi:dihydrolipoamide dehydrogenase